MIRKDIIKYLKSIKRKNNKTFIEGILSFFYFCLYRNSKALFKKKLKKLHKLFIKSDNKTVSKLYLRARSFKRHIKDEKINFVTTDELIIWTSEWIKSFPTTYDIIVGIPRSGLLVANLIALKLGKPLTTPELFIQGKYWKSKLMDGKMEFKNILLVEDTITHGTTIKESLQLLQPYCKNLNITKAALIATEKSKMLVDLYYKILSSPRLFEWNISHVKKGKTSLDMDGVICENCPPGVDLDEDVYIKWIKNAKPYLIPAFEIDAIISNRLEKYRIETERWLTKHGVRYRELILWDIQSKQERNGKYAQRKIETLLKIKPDIFWESSANQAEQIYKITKIPTLCIDEMSLFI